MEDWLDTLCAVVWLVAVGIATAWVVITIWEAL